ncbi:MAG TPA: gamma-glutamyltransferase [Anaeromyxobacteraceae bacterium]|nr:gamma-glutamyltransferase [Anaeromyxobacteraceae bacterium]
MTPAALLLQLALSLAAASPKGAIATAHPLASEAGAAVMRRGGNAVDAAVAAAFALSVVENQNSGIGGGGFAVVWLARERAVRVLDFREVAPAAASRDMFLREGRPDPALSRDGGLAVAVPGAVKGYAELARRFGTRPLSELVEPAARLAGSGWRLGLLDHRTAALRLECLRADPAAAREFLVPAPGGERVPPEPGTTRRRPELARTLRLLGRDSEAFYRGPLARKVVAAVRARGGVLTEADLDAYRVREREPLWGSYRGHRLATVPLPSAGGAILVGLLRALEGEDPGAGGFRPERFLHVFAEVEKRLFARRGLLGDPDFAPAAEAAAREMASPEVARALRAEVSERATPSPDLALPGHAGETSHVSAVDGEGNAVALTTTVNLLYGSCVVVPGTGILLDDQMDDFDAAPGASNAFGLQGGAANAVAPGKRPLSSMAPALLFDPRGRLVLAVGSSGGSTIPSTVAQVMVGLLDWGMSLPAALGTPRIHHQWMPDEILAEPFALDADTARALEARGHRLRFADRPFGNPQAVQVDPGTGWRQGASEPRWQGAPAVP